jgi:hypothetical protein
MTNRTEKKLLELNPSQLAAVDLVMLGLTDREVAEKIGVARETVTRWRLYHPAFQAELNGRRRALAESSLDRLRNLIPTALQTLESGLTDVTNTERFRLALHVLKATGTLGSRLTPGYTDPAEIIAERAMKEHGVILREFLKEHHIVSTYSHILKDLETPSVEKDREGHGDKKHADQPIRNARTIAEGAQDKEAEQGLPA